MQRLYNIIFIHLNMILKHLPWNCYDIQYTILYIFSITHQKPLLFFKIFTYFSELLGLFHENFKPRGLSHSVSVCGLRVV